MKRIIGLVVLSLLAAALLVPGSAQARLSDREVRAKAASRLRATVARERAKIDPGRRLLTVFDCTAEQFHEDVTGTFITATVVCAEHLGNHYYRSYVLSETFRQDPFIESTANYSFDNMELYYYCNAYPNCIKYDGPLDRSGYVNVHTAIGVGNNIGCPGASNNGKVLVLAVWIRYHPYNRPLEVDYLTGSLGIPFNSSC